MAKKFVITTELNLRGITGVKPQIAALQKSLNSLKANVNLNINAKSVANLAALNKNLTTTQTLLASCATSATTLKTALSGLGQSANAVNKGLGGTNTATNTLSNNVNKVSNNLNQAANGMFNFGKNSATAIKKFGSFTLVTSGIISFGIAIKSAVKEALEFQHGLVRLSQISGVSVKNLGGLAKEIGFLSTTLGVSSNELLKVSDTLAQAGLSIDEVKIALEGLAKTQLAPTFGNLENTVEAAIASMRQFNIPVEKLKETLGSFNSVAAAFAVESDDISTAVRRSGAAFEAAGGNLDEFIALFTSVRQTTREGAETIATGFRTIFTRLQRPKTLEFLDTLGVKLTNLEGQFVGPYEAVRRLSSALANVESTDPRFAQIVEELGGFRQVSKVIPLLQQFSVAEKALAVARRGRTSLDRDAATAQESLIVQLTQLREKFFGLFRTIGNNDSIRSFISLTLKLSETLLKMADSLSGLIPLFATLGAIKLGAGLRNFGAGFGAGVKQPRKFARGGLVPGNGNGDTVPAMLTPGEYVLPKRAVKKLGTDSIQKFADGGTVEALQKKQFGLISLFRDPSPENLVDISPESRSIRANYINERISKKTDLKQGGLGGFNTKSIASGIVDAQGNYNYQLYSGTVAPSFAKSFEEQIQKDLEGIANNEASKLGANIGAVSAGLKPGDIKKFNFEQMSGNLFEAALSGLGIPYTGGSGKTLSTDPFDFFHGVPAKLAKNVFQDEKIAAIPSDAKRTLNSDTKGSISDKIIDLMTTSIITSKISKIDDKAKNSLNNIKTQFLAGSLSEASARSQLSNFTKPLGIKGLSKSDKPDKLIDSIIGTRNFANGGAASGSDSVPAMLTPGEYVLDKATAQRVGYGNLEKVRKYAKGGVVHKFASGGKASSSGAVGGGNGLGALLFVIPTLTGLLDKMSGEVGQTVAQFSTLAITAGFMGKQFINAEKVTRSFAIAAKLDTQGKTSRASKVRRGGIGEIAGGVLATAGILATGVGDFFDKQAQTNIEQGKFDSGDSSNLTRGSVLGGAGTGAVTGAAIGSAIPIVGTAIGALIGGVAGGLYGLLSDSEEKIQAAKNKVQTINFTKSVESLGKDLENAISGKGDRDILRSKIKSGLIDRQNEISAASGPQQAELIRAGEGKIPQIEELGNQIAGSVKSIEEFKNASNGLGTEIIFTLSRLTGLPFSELEQSFDKIIKANINSAKIQSNLNAANLKLFNQRQVVNDMVRGFFDAGKAMDQFTNEANNVINDFKSFSFTTDLAGDITGGLEGNSGALGSSLKQLFGGVSNTDVQQLVESMSKASENAKALPQILVDSVDSALRKPELGDAGGFIGAIRDSMKDQDFGEPIKDVIVQALNSQLSGDSFNQDFLEKVRGNPQEFAQELLAETQGLLDAIGKAAEVAVKQSNEIIKMIQARGELEQQINDRTISIKKSSIQINRTRSAIGTTDFEGNSKLTTADLIKGRNQQRGVRTKDVRLATSNSDAGEIANAILAERAKLRSNNDALQKSSVLDPNGVKKFAEEISKGTRKVAELTVELEDQATNTAVLNSLQADLNRTTEQRLKKRALASDLAFGGNEGRREFSNQINLASIIAKNPNAVGTQQQEQGALSGLEKIISAGAGDTQLEAFGGKSANQVKQAREFAFLRSQGLSAKDAQQIVSTSKTELDIQNKILKEEERMRSALESLNKIDAAKLNDLNGICAKGFDRMVQAFNASVADAEVDRKSGDLTKADSNAKQNRAKLDASNQLQEDFKSLGMSDIKQLPLDKFKTLDDLKAQSEFLNQDPASNVKLQERLNAIKTTSGITDNVRENRRRETLFSDSGTTLDFLRKSYEEANQDLIKESLPQFTGYNGSDGEATFAPGVAYNPTTDKEKLDQRVRERLIKENQQQQDNNRLDIGSTTGLQTDKIKKLEDDRVTRNRINSNNKIVGNSTNEELQNQQSATDRAAIDAANALEEAKKRRAGIYRAKGGIIRGKRAKNHPINGMPAKGGDDVPLMAKNGEYVLTEQDVKNMGGAGRIDRLRGQYMTKGGSVGGSIASGVDSVMSGLFRTLNNTMQQLTGAIKGQTVVTKKDTDTTKKPTRVDSGDDSSKLHPSIIKEREARAKFAADKKTKEDKDRLERREKRDSRGFSALDQSPKAKEYAAGTEQRKADYLKKKSDLESSIKAKAAYAKTPQGIAENKEKARIAAADKLNKENSQIQNDFDAIRDGKQRFPSHKGGAVDNQEAHNQLYASNPEYKDRTDKINAKIKYQQDSNAETFAATSAAYNAKRKGETDAYVADLPAATARNRAAMAETNKPLVRPNINRTETENQARRSMINQGGVDAQKPFIQSRLNATTNLTDQFANNFKNRNTPPTTSIRPVGTPASDSIKQFTDVGNSIGKSLTDGLSSGAALLDKTLKGIPHVIEFAGKVDPIQLIVNGAEAFSQLQPLINRLVTEAIERAKPVGSGPTKPTNNQPIAPPKV